jgi:predicted metal-binding membrane protein
VVVDRRADDGDGRRTGHRARLARLVHRRLGDDDGGDDAAVARAGGSRVRGVGPSRAQPSLLFAAGYLLVWAVAGISAYGLFELGKSLFADSLAWNDGGRWLAAGVLVLAALYELTPPKRVFLARCRGVVRFQDSPSHSTRPGAFAIGLRNGGWCLGCTWALMAGLFALGVMSLAWMGLIAVLVALEKIGPSAPGTRLATTAILVVLAAAILTVPYDVPGFVVPDSPSSPHAMKTMG